MPESTQHRLDRVRKPRVHITYDLEIGDSIEKREIPFVVGVLSDLSGQPADPLPRLADRKFINIDQDNFDDVLAGIKPRVDFMVPNRLADDGTELRVEMEFSKMDDFRPEAIADRFEPLRRLMDLRRKLSDLAAVVDGNQPAEDTLQKFLRDTKPADGAGDGQATDASQGKKEE